MDDKKNHKRGRPPKMTEKVLSDLIYAYGIGCTDIEACAYADISRSVLYRYMDEHPDFKDRRDRLKENPTLKARQALYNALSEGDGVTMRWYLEKKKSDEFSARHEIDINQTGSLSIESRSQALNAFLSRFNPEGVEG